MLTRPKITKIIFIIVVTILLWQFYLLITPPPANYVTSPSYKKRPKVCAFGTYLQVIYSYHLPRQKWSVEQSWALGKL